MAEQRSRIVLGGSSLEKLTDSDLDLLLTHAFSIGICEIDSAPTYGNIESRLGRIIGDDPAWVINSKVGDNRHLDFPADGIIGQVENSLHLLGRRRLGTVFVHSIPLVRLSEVINSSLDRLKIDGLTNSIGFSSNSNFEDLQRAARNPIFDRFQVTCNILDQTNLNAISEKSSEQIYLKRIFGSGVLKSHFIDDLKLETKKLLGLKNRFDINDYHYRFKSLFGITFSKMKFNQIFFEYVLSLGTKQRLIVGTTNINHLKDLVRLEKQGPPFNLEQFVDYSRRFRDLESKYGWVPYR